MKTIFYLLLVFSPVLLTGCGRDGAPKSRQSHYAQLKSCSGFVSTPSGSQLFWSQEFPIPLFIATSVPESLRSGIVAAVNTWNKSLNFEVFSISPEIIDSGESKKDGINAIYFAQNWPTHGEAEQASTMLYWSHDKIYEADILINADNFWFSTDPDDGEVDLESLIGHELGHVLGLAHVESEESIMVESLKFGEKRRFVSDMDIKNFNCRYKATK